MYWYTQFIKELGQLPYRNVFKWPSFLSNLANHVDFAHSDKLPTLFYLKWIIFFSSGTNLGTNPVQILNNYCTKKKMAQPSSGTNLGTNPVQILNNYCTKKKMAQPAYAFHQPTQDLYECKVIQQQNPNAKIISLVCFHHMIARSGTVDFFLN